MNDLLPITGSNDSAVSIPAAHVVPALVASLGDAASWRFIEFFTANIRNPHTRRAYARACRYSREYGLCVIALVRHPIIRTG